MKIMFLLEKYNNKIVKQISKAISVIKLIIDIKNNEVNLATSLTIFDISLEFSLSS